LGVRDSNVLIHYRTTRFVAKGVEGEDWAVPVDHLPVTDNNGKGAAFLIYPNNKDYLPLIRTIYPGGKEEVIKSPDGAERFTSYKLSREQMAGFQKLHATYTGKDGRKATQDEPQLGTAGAAGAWNPPNLA